MFKFIKTIWISCAILIFPCSSICLALVGIHERGMWPSSWPKELEPYRKQAKTFEVGTGIQENVYEINFKDRKEFEEVWPIVLKLKSKGAPLRLRSIEPFKSGRLFNNEKPVVRIYGPAYRSAGVSRPRGKLLYPVPPWPELVKLPDGTLPEYVTMSEDGTTWVRVEEGRPKGFMCRARFEIELVVDGEIIDLNRIRLPANTPIIDKRKFENQSE